MTIRKKQNKLDQRTKIIMIIVLIFVVILAFSYINLRQKSKKIAKEQAAGGIPDQETRREEKRIKEEKRIYQDKEFYLKKTATEKFWTIVPGRVLYSKDS